METTPQKLLAAESLSFAGLGVVDHLEGEKNYHIGCHKSNEVVIIVNEKPKTTGF